MDLKNLKANIALIEQGEWVKDIPGLGNIELLVRGAFNSEWKKLYRALVDELPRERKIGGMPRHEDDRDRIYARCIAETALLDWKNITEDGEPIPFSKEKALELMTNPAMLPFQNGVSLAIGFVGEARASDIEEAKKS